MPDNLTASEVEELKRLITFVSFDPAMTNSSDFKVMKAFWPHLPALLRAWEEQSKMALDLLSAETQAQNAVSRAETAEHEREVMRRERDAARAEVADLRRKLQEKCQHTFAFGTPGSKNAVCRDCGKDIELKVTP